MSYLRREHRESPHWVYRLYDVEDRLLYIGCTVKHPVARMQQLYGENPAIARAPFARLDAAPYRNSVEAIMAEGRLIDLYQPHYNIGRSAVSLRRAAGLPS